LDCFPQAEALDGEALFLFRGRVVDPDVNLHHNRIELSLVCDRETLKDSGVWVVPANFKDALVVDVGVVTLTCVIDATAEERVEIEAVIGQEAEGLCL
jgi:hypothetical protein